MTTHLSYLETAWFIILVVLFFNVMIFVHNLGHFLAGKWRGATSTASGYGSASPSGRKSADKQALSFVRRMVGLVCTYLRIAFQMRCTEKIAKILIFHELGILLRN